MRTIETFLVVSSLPVVVDDGGVSISYSPGQTFRGATNLYTVPTGRSAVITGAVVVPTTATAVTVVPTAGIGIAAGEEDIFSSDAMTGLDSTTKRFRFDSAGTARIGAAAEVIKIGVDVAATATALVADVYLIGYLI